MNIKWGKNPWVKEMPDGVEAQKSEDSDGKTSKKKARFQRHNLTYIKMKKMFFKAILCTHG